MNVVQSVQKEFSAAALYGREAEKLVQSNVLFKWNVERKLHFFPVVPPAI